jgi:UDP-N-acetylmuramoylalanine--D-glutamate ligase
MIPVTHLAGKRIAVFGLGLSGIASAQALRAGGAEPVVWDDGEKGRAAAIQAGLTTVDLREADWSGLSALVLAPGVPLTHPQPHWTVERARAAGVEVIGDTELFCRERRHLGSRAKIAAITGTNGKSTTTALTHHLLRAAGRRAAIGGNFGTAVLALDPLADDMHYVIEYSSFQIDLTPTLDASTACLLNITPDHLDRHGTLENYAAVKSRIFDRLGPDGTAVIGIDDKLSARIADIHERHTNVRRISVDVVVNDGVYATSKGWLVERVDGDAAEPLSLDGIGSLRGAHNWQNAACAYAMTRALGLSREEIAAGLASFPGLAHRMEQVGRLGRVLFINDSKATNADAAGKALASFDNIFWIAGGLAKAGGLMGLEGFWPRIRRAYLIGEAAEAFSAHLGGAVPHQISRTLEQAVAEASRDAQASGVAEPVVLLSPACASYDQFPSFTARGDAFRAQVADMSGITLFRAGAT